MVHRLRHVPAFLLVISCSSTANRKCLLRGRTPAQPESGGAQIASIILAAWTPVNLVAAASGTGRSAPRGRRGRRVSADDEDDREARWRGAPHPAGCVAVARFGPAIVRSGQASVSGLCYQPSPMA